MRTTTLISIIIADDHEIYLDGLTGFFNGQKQFQLLAQCRDGDQLVRAVEHHKPDVVVTDLNMPVVSGTEAIRRIHSSHPEVRVLALTIFDHEMMIVDALEAGARGYITKDSSKKQLFEAIETVYHNHPYYCTNTTAKLVRLISNSNFNPYGKEKKTLFTDTEKKIIQLICEDKSVKEMSKELFLAERTVEKYRATVFNKMNVKTVAGVAIYAIKHRLYFVKEQ